MGEFEEKKGEDAARRPPLGDDVVILEGEWMGPSTPPSSISDRGQGHLHHRHSVGRSLAVASTPYHQRSGSLVGGILHRSGGKTGTEDLVSSGRSARSESEGEGDRFRGPSYHFRDSGIREWEKACRSGKKRPAAKSRTGGRGSRGGATAPCDFSNHGSCMKYVPDDSEDASNHGSCVKYVPDDSEDASAEYLCTACGNPAPLSELRIHPLKNFPVIICSDCLGMYMLGSFYLDEKGKEVYCRWCGDGGMLQSCDAEDCRYSFCTACILRNYGNLTLPDHWKCFICDPQCIKDRFYWEENIIKKGKALQRPAARTFPWDYRETGTKSGSHRYVVMDISMGQEHYPIEAVNERDDVRLRFFSYTTKPILRSGEPYPLLPGYTTGCNCTGNCLDSLSCECATLTYHLPAGMTRSIAYDIDHRLGTTPGVFPIFECNPLCSCHSSCSNRVAGGRLHLRLQIFRCSDVRKGWGLRCLDAIPEGSFVATYMGELLPDNVVEETSVDGDEYLWNLDFLHYNISQSLMESAGIWDLYNCLAEGNKRPMIIDKGTLDKVQAAANRYDVPFAEELYDLEKLKKVLIGIRDEIVSREEQKRGWCIDGKNHGNVGRFINHSCEPNLHQQVIHSYVHGAEMPTVAFFANRAIDALEELTYDYGYRENSASGRKMSCRCGTKSCRKILL